MSSDLADKEAIKDTIIKFCWGIDTKIPLSSFPGAFEDVFTEDFQFGLARERVLPKDAASIPLNAMGRAGFASFIETVQGKYEATQHHCTNTLVSITGAGTATAVTYAANYHKKKDGTMFNYFGVYDDQLVKTADGWRISIRRQYPLYSEGSPAPNPA